MDTQLTNDERRRIDELAADLREATCAAFEHGSALARPLDESRCELERLSMSSAIEVTEYRRVTLRARMMLDAWHGMAVGFHARAR